jgi:hypothetical protein
MSSTSSLGDVNALATHTAFSVLNLASDFLVVIIVVALLFLFAWYVGRGPFVAILLAFYAAYAAYATFPYMSYLPSAPPLSSVLAHIGLYAAFVFAFYLVLRRVIVSDFLYIGIFGLAILAFVGAAFLIALGYHVFAISAVYHFSSAIDMLFAAKQYFFLWFAAPAVGLFFLAR